MVTLTHAIGSCMARVTRGARAMQIMIVENFMHDCKALSNTGRNTGRNTSRNTGRLAIRPEPVDQSARAVKRLRRAQPEWALC